MSPPPSIFVTGFPGFIAGRLVASLLAGNSDLRVVVLVESGRVEQAQAIASQVGADRIDVLEGDIAKSRLGLSTARYQQLAAETTSTYHLAALYDLAVELEPATRVNVDGTANVLELCVGCSQLERLHYVSTAYVAGDRQGTVYEHELVLGQRFKNHYESTKFQAELWARERMSEIPTTVYRPAIVVGDSRSGATQKFDGPYYLLRVISLMERHGLPIPQFGRSEAPFNVVPVDFIVEAILAAAGDPAAVGQTLHLVDPDPMPAAELLRILSHSYAGREPSLRVPSALVAESLRIPAVQKLFGGAPREGMSYLNHAVRFDSRQAEELFARNDLRCPSFEEYTDVIVRFFRENESALTTPPDEPWTRQQGRRTPNRTSAHPSSGRASPAPNH